MKRKKCFIVFFFVIILIFSNAEVLVSSSKNVVDVDNDFKDFDLSFLKHFDKYDPSQMTEEDRDFILNFSLAIFNDENTFSEKNNVLIHYVESISVPVGGLMDSAWPMYCHDLRHTGRSPYNARDTWGEVWRIHYDKFYIESGVAVANDGTIYYGSFDFFAAFPNGTIKWVYDISDTVQSCPALNSDGMIYVGTDMSPCYMHCFYPNGTHNWSYNTGAIYSSPAIADDGTIFFGDWTGRITALYPNGSLRWSYQTENVVLSSPAIGDDGTVYCGSHDTYLYALNPNNGSLKWRFKTNGWVRVSPCIADDGTIYVVSFDNYLYAINSDGSLKWNTYMGEAGTSPTIGWDGTIYCGYTTLHAVYPSNGTVKWAFNVGGTMQGSTPCHSSEDIIFFGTHLTDYAGGGDFVAVNPDGTQRWRKRIAEGGLAYVDSPAAIGSDGRVYVGSASTENIGGSIYAIGYLYAFGWVDLSTDANGPYYGLVGESVQFDGYASGGYVPFSYHWDFGDEEVSDLEDPVHVYTSAGNYSVTLTVTDRVGNSSSDTSWVWVQDGNSPPDKPNIIGPTEGVPFQFLDFTFSAVDPEGGEVWYFVDWDDNTNTGWLGPYPSDSEKTLSHYWVAEVTFTIRCKAKDVYGLESDWGTFDVTIPRSRLLGMDFFLQFLQNHPNMFPIIRQILEL